MSRQPLERKRQIAQLAKVSLLKYFVPDTTSDCEVRVVCSPAFVPIEDISVSSGRFDDNQFFAQFAFDGGQRVKQFSHGLRATVGDIPSNGCDFPVEKAVVVFVVTTNYRQSPAIAEAEWEGRVDVRPILRFSAQQDAFEFLLLIVS